MHAFHKKTFNRPKKARKPWITSEHLFLIRKRDQLYKNFIQTRCPDVLSAFKKYRKYVTKELRTAKNRYYYHRLISSSQSSGDMWRKLNTIIGRGTEHITRIVKDNLEISGEELANAFNDSFLRNIPLSSGSDSFPYMQPRCEHTMFLWPTSESEIIATYTSLKNSTATDNAELQIKPVKFVIDLIAPYLTHIINSCIS